MCVCKSFHCDWQPANTKTCTQGGQRAVGGSACILFTGVVSEFDRKEIGAARPLPAFQKGQLQPTQFILLSAAGEPWHRAVAFTRPHSAQDRHWLYSSWSFLASSLFTQQNAMLSGILDLVWYSSFPNWRGKPTVFHKQKDLYSGVVERHKWATSRNLSTGRDFQIPFLLRLSKSTKAIYLVYLPYNCCTCCLKAVLGSPH